MFRVGSWVRQLEKAHSDTDMPSAAEIARLARSETGKQRRASGIDEGRLSANSVDGEYWGDAVWSRDALTAGRQASTRQEKLGREPTFFSDQKMEFFRQGEERLNLEDDMLFFIHKLGLKMKLPMQPKPSAASSAAGGSNRQAIPLSKLTLASISGSGSGSSSGAPEQERNGACFGEISWTRQDQEISSRTFGVAKYACFKDDTNVSDVFRLLSECWKLKAPSVLISVTGSAQELNLEPKLAKDFEKGLADAAECTDGWVVTGGTDTGVMALVGRALRSRQLAGDAR